MLSIFLEETTYELLSQYILDEEQLVENGYPRQCPSTPGKVTFKPRRPLPTPSKDRKYYKLVFEVIINT